MIDRDDITKTVAQDKDYIYWLRPVGRARQAEIHNFKIVSGDVTDCYEVKLMRVRK